jgi:hypothetical protein
LVQGKGPFLLRDPYGAKKCAKKSVALPTWLSAKTIFLRSGAEGGPDFTSRVSRVDVSQFLKGRSEKVAAVHNLGLIDALVEFAAPIFLVRLSL